MYSKIIHLVFSVQDTVSSSKRESTTINLDSVLKNYSKWCVRKCLPTVKEQVEPVFSNFLLSTPLFQKKENQTGQGREKAMFNKKMHLPAVRKLGES